MKGKTSPHFIAAAVLVVFIVLGLACASVPADQAQDSGAGGISVPALSAASGIDELDIAIRDASDYLNENIPRGSKIVILNIESNSPDLSDYIIDELIANAVNDRAFTVVDRQQLDTIRAEQNFQLSGEVDDNDALAIGRFFGAQTIVSGAVNRLGTGYRIRIRALEVQTAQVQGQYNKNIASSPIITSLLASGGTPTASGGSTASSGSASGTPSTASSGTTASSGSSSSTPSTVSSGSTASGGTVAQPLVTGTVVPGNSLAEKFAWLQRSAESHNTYILEVNANENISPTTLNYTGAINITVAIRGIGENRTIRLSQNGTMFMVNSNVTFVLEENITLSGHPQNNNYLVQVNGGILKMNHGSAITGNTRGGVYVSSEGTFEMNGGTISGNTNAGNGGGVNVYEGTFTMTGGTISGNTASGASWPYSSRGGGVFVRGTFTMTGGTISGNGTSEQGGGVYVVDGVTFNMRGGTITNNSAVSNGGGVYGDITKTGGTITGYSSDQSNGNVVRDESGNVLARRGHAVWAARGRRETTAGPGVNLSRSSAGGWEQ